MPKMLVSRIPVFIKTFQTRIFRLRTLQLNGKLNALTTQILIVVLKQPKILKQGLNHSTKQAK
jgi:hypothetical protein